MRIFAAEGKLRKLGFMFLGLTNKRRQCAAAGSTVRAGMRGSVVVVVCHFLSKFRRRYVSKKVHQNGSSSGLDRGALMDCATVGVSE
jgi:hypothetical protein